MNQINEKSNVFEAYRQIISESGSDLFSDILENVQKTIEITEIKVDIKDDNNARKNALQDITDILKQNKLMSIKNYKDNIISRENDFENACEELNRFFSRRHEEAPSATTPVSSSTSSEITS